MFGWKKHEKEEFANLASSLILAGAVGANPILLIVSIVSWAKSYTKDKNKKAFKEGTIKGLLGMGSFIMTASLFASPLLGLSILMPVYYSYIGLVVMIVINLNSNICNHYKSIALPTELQGHRRNINYFLN